jgi:hypothetical protein
MTSVRHLSLAVIMIQLFSISYFSTSVSSQEEPEKADIVVIQNELPENSDDDVSGLVTHLIEAFDRLDNTADVAVVITKSWLREHSTMPEVNMTDFNDAELDLSGADLSNLNLSGVDLERDLIIGPVRV